MTAAQPRARFLHADFLLQSEPARRLYHEYAEGLPIIDYHCHLSPELIAVDHRFENLTQIWLAGDHYKWRAMRANGVDENRITGNASDWEKFEAWAATVPWTVRNPLYHWTHLELKRPLGWQGLLDVGTAAEVYAHANALLPTPAFSVGGLLRQFDVRLVCTTDDPVDDLSAHRAIAQRGEGPRVLPTFRPDRGLIVTDASAFNAWVARLEAAAGRRIVGYADYLAALDVRLEAFHAAGCRLSDHGLEFIPAVDFTEAEVVACFDALRRGSLPSIEGRQQFLLATLEHLCRGYAARGWAQQFHLGALRNTAPRLMRRLGADSGVDSIGDFAQVQGVARLLGRLDDAGQLARTILYNLNPADNAAFATLIGNFQDGKIAGKIQYGSGWWFLDQKQGMEDQLNALSNMGLLARFVGMVTDSRSFLSYSRHEYFRRVLCNLIGADIARGELPADYTWLGEVVRRICFQNAADYFTFDPPVTA